MISPQRRRGRREKIFSVPLCLCGSLSQGLLAVGGGWVETAGDMGAEGVLAGLMTRTGPVVTAGSVVVVATGVGAGFSVSLFANTWS